MANVNITKAKRSRARLRLGLAAPSGSGKTVGALLIGYGIMKATYPDLPEDKLWEKIGLIDTERSSAELEVGKEFYGAKIGEFYHTNLGAPYTPKNYTSAIEAMEQLGVEYIIIDSLSHAWSGEGGATEKASMIAKQGGQNSWSAWREVSPDNARLVDKLLQSPAHIVVTLRVKTEWVVEDDGKGRKVPKALGLKPIFKEDIEYEFTIFFDIDKNHITKATKDRTSLFDGEVFTITPKTGKDIYNWLMSAEEKPEVQRAVKETEHEPASETLLQTVTRLITAKVKSLNAEEKKPYIALVVEVAGKIDYRDADEKTLKKLKAFFNQNDEDMQSLLEAPAETRMLALEDLAQKE